jgi:broad specificity phosphatase PhoE
MKLFVIRHGQTDLNKQRKTQGGGVDPDINETGIQESLCLQNFFKQQNLGRISLATSPLKRAIQTMENIFPGREYEVSDILRERNLGIIESLSYEEVEEKYPNLDYIQRPGKNAFCKNPPEGESVEDTLARMQNIKTFLQQNAKNENIDTQVIVTHGGVIRFLHSILSNTPIEEVVQTVFFKNCEMAIYTLTPEDMITFDGFEYHC